MPSVGSLFVNPAQVGYNQQMQFVRFAAVRLLLAFSVDTWGSVSASAETPTAPLFGQVTTLQGNPLTGVEVKAQDGRNQPVGHAKTDAQGRFQLVLNPAISDVTLVIESTGYRRFALSGFVPDGKTKAVQLTRNVDAPYLTALLAETDPSRFRLQVADLLTPSSGSTGHGMPEEVLLPFLTPLCTRLRPFARTDGVRLRERNLPAELDSVMHILAYCSDPVDDPLIDAWRQGSGNYAKRPNPPCMSDTLDGAVRMWTDQHFQQEGLKPAARPPTNTRIQLSPNKDRALVSVSVEYAHWGYQNTLVLVQKKNRWVVRLVLGGEIWHSD